MSGESAFSISQCKAGSVPQSCVTIKAFLALFSGKPCIAMTNFRYAIDKQDGVRSDLIVTDLPFP